MDPNATLRRIEDLLSAGMGPSDIEEVTEALDDLHAWLTSGGFAPRSWARYPRATAAYRNDERLQRANVHARRERNGY
jgi:hypothetical protein